MVFNSNGLLPSKLSCLRSVTVVLTFALSNVAFGQSTGSTEMEGAAETYTISANNAEEGIKGMVIPDTPKAQGVITPELISRQVVGQTILNTINFIPGVNFTNSDPYGFSGGNLRIRGFDGSRISLTQDGIPLNDSGNYAIYSNQQLDPELIKMVNVNLGTTDVDSPTASAAGGTVNYMSLIPDDKLRGELNTSIGDNNYYRVFGFINLGKLTDFGTKAWVAASTARYDLFRGPGEIDRQQYNARIYQPVGDNGDFISLSAHYNHSRPDSYFFPSVGGMANLFNVGGATVIPTTDLISSASPLDLSNLTGAQQSLVNDFNNLATCTRTSGGAGVQNDSAGIPGANPAFTAPNIAGSKSNNILNAASCTNYRGVRINPSDTANVRLNSSFKLPLNLTLTTDAAFQFVLANGGGYTTLAENSALAKGANVAGQGVDFNNDGDFSDTIGFYRPANTNTYRYTLTSSLIWDPILGHRFRLGYTFDLARHRQTGDWGSLDAKGNPTSVFGGLQKDPVFASDGFQMENRNRLSYAMLNQLAAQYVGFLLDDKLHVEAGLRVPFFQRDLNQFCYTSTSTGNPLCTSQPEGPNLVVVAPGAVAPFPANSYYRPFTASYYFSQVLPNAGLRYKIIDELSAFASYARGFSAPRTDDLYVSPTAVVSPETTNAVDVGLRYNTPKVLAQASGWYIGYQNRIVSSYLPDLGLYIDRNVGNVDSWGIDTSAAVQPVEMATLMMFGSYIHSQLNQDVQIGGTAANPILAPTTGKQFSETPNWMVGGRAEFDIGPLSLGFQAKWVSNRFATDVNDVIVPGYVLLDADARVSFKKFFKQFFGIDDAYVQVNATNLMNQFYFGSINTQISYGAISGISGSNPSFSIGAPRTFQGTFHMVF